MNKTMGIGALFITISILFPAFNIYALERVNSKMSLEKTEIICRNWASSSQKLGVNTLVLGIEGWISFNQGYANKLYQYHDALVKGKNKRAPDYSKMNFVAKNLIKPHIKELYNSVDYLLMPETSEDIDEESVSQRCIKSWYQVHGDNLKLKIISHSFGGNAARKLVQKLSKSLSEFTDIEMLTIDPRSPRPSDTKNKFYSPENVRDNYVFYQKYTPFLWGYPFVESGNTINKKLERGDFASKDICKGNNHARTTCAPAVVETYLKLLSN